jgi:Chaperone of endosialidase
LKNQPIQNTAATETQKEKLTWETPTVQEYSPRLILQQEEEELMRLLADENAFKLLTGSVNPSDYRLKEDAQEFSGLELVNRIQVYNYAWKADGNREYGVMAHELQTELPYLVTGSKDEVDAEGQPRIQRVNYAKLVPVLLRAIQEQQEMISELREKIGNKINEENNYQNHNNLIL